MGAHNISIESIISGSVSDEDENVLYEEKIDESELKQALDEFANEVNTYVNDCKNKIEYIDGELEKTNSDAFYYGGEASKQLNKLTTASQHFDELRNNSFYCECDSIINKVKDYNNKLCDLKWKVRINLCNKRIKQINDKRPASIDIDNPRKQKGLSMIYPKKEEKFVDGIYKDTRVPNEVSNTGNGYKITWTIERTVCIKETANKNNVIELEAKIKKTGAKLLYDESKAGWD